MRGEDWIPSHEEEMVSLIARWDEAASDAAKRTAFGWDATACANLVNKITEFLAARSAYREVDSSANLVAKNNAKKVVEKMMREFANSYIRFNPKMSEEDKQYFGIYARDSHNTPKPAPTDHVEFTLKVDGQAHIVRADYRIEGEVGHSKGRYHGVEVRIWVLPLDASGPLTADDLTWRSEVDTATPWSHTFDAHEIGQRLYIAMRWENVSVGKNKAASKGPWGTIQSVVIA